jgi:hypothetical protein
LNGLEIDILIPSEKLGIEFDGLKWHSERYGKDKMYHLRKTLQANEKGIRLIHIFEDEWLEHKGVVLSKISHILGIDDNRIKIGGRKCTVGIIRKDKAEKFLNKWHIQGFASSTLYYRAHYGDVLVGVMSFKYYSNKDEWELTRFATDINYSCQGIGGKLFKYFIRTYNPEKIKSFADRRWTINKDNNLYTKIGFKFEKYTAPDYKYAILNENIRKHKFGFRKNTLHKKYDLPLTMTESEMAKKIKAYKIWDCGLIKYVWEKE